METKTIFIKDTTAFTSYGLFWLTLVGLLVFPKTGIGTAPGAFAMAMYLFMWGIFTAFMFIGTLKGTNALKIVFGTLTILFFLLGIGYLTGILLFVTLPFA